MIEDLIRRNRTCRRFRGEKALGEEAMRSLVELARLSASSGNAQPLKFILSCDAQRNELIFPCLQWAYYLEDWDGPEPEQRPSGYIVILGDTNIAKNYEIDTGIAAQSIVLGAAMQGLAGCMFGSVDAGRLRKALDIPDHLDVALIIALGEPAEEIVLEETGPDGDIRYWRDEQGVHHVPKRPLDELII
jgi:nitroreductase